MQAKKNERLKEEEAVRAAQAAADLAAGVVRVPRSTLPARDLLGGEDHDIVV